MLFMLQLKVKQEENQTDSVNVEITPTGGSKALKNGKWEIRDSSCLTVQPTVKRSRNFPMAASHENEIHFHQR